jgi:hypothetical protein
LEFCARKTGAIWLHNTITANAVIGLKDIRFFIK